MKVNMEEEKMTIFRGCGTAIVTPFNEDGTVDFTTFGRNINWQINEGIDAIIVCGTTGEASTMTDLEQIEVIRYCVETVNGRVPVIAGAGSNDTLHGIELAKKAEEVGADGLLLITPYYNKCSQNGLIEHFTATAQAVTIPCILYSVKGRTGVNIEPETVRILANHPNIVGLKEASGDISQVAEILRIVPDDFAVYSGNDDMVVPTMALGGVGYISVISNIAPSASVEMSRAFLEGDLNRARELQLTMKPLIDLMFVDVNPIPVKAALNLMDRSELNYRLPLCPPEQALIDEIRVEMTSCGLI